MRVLILGGDGYLGWATAMRLSARGHEVAVVDNYARRRCCDEVDVRPLIDTPLMDERAALWKAASGHSVAIHLGDVCDYPFLVGLFTGFRPEAVVHYAEQPSAPYSMMGRDKAAFTIVNNLTATTNVAFAVRDHCPGCHIVKLGTMGEYGTPNIDIEEGYLDITHKGRSDRFLFPKTPGSIYHVTKVQDSDLLYFGCRIWGLAVTDLNQGPVYGIRTEEMGEDARLAPIFNYDDVFGTVLNRFAVQAVTGVPLTVYGKGGQVRGYIDIRDTLQCVELVLEKPAAKGEFRVYNQFTETFSVCQLADKVKDAAKLMGIDVAIDHIPNPRKEAEEHYYNPTNTGLHGLGLKPHRLDDEFLVDFIGYVRAHAGNVDRDHILPKVHWT